MQMPFLPEWENADVIVNFFAAGLEDDGTSAIAATYAGRCRFTESTKTVLNRERKEVLSTGSIIIQGDAAPTVKDISNGEVIVNEVTYHIISASRPRNFDGTVYYTELVLE